MYIYLAVFFISAFLLYVSERKHGKKSKKVLIAIAILLPAILAGLRASTVGTDVNMYAIAYYKEAVVSSTFFEYLAKHVNSLLSEPMYYVVTFGMSRIFKDYHWGLFVYQLIPLIFIYLGLVKCRKKYNTPVWLGMLLYYFMLYNNSLNIIRQCIAVGITFYAFTYLFDKEYKKYALFSILAVTFHTSALLSFAILPMYLILQQGKEVNVKKQIFRGFFFIFALIGVLAAGDVFVQRLVDMGIMRSYYLEYLNGGKFSTTGGISYVVVAIECVYIILQIAHYKIMNRKRLDNLFFTMSTVVVLISNVALLTIQNVERLGYFFIPLQVVTLANLSVCYSKKSRPGYYVIITLIVFIIWLYLIVEKGAHETVPYKFFFSE